MHRNCTKTTEGSFSGNGIIDGINVTASGIAKVIPRNNMTVFIEGNAKFITNDGDKAPYTFQSIGHYNKDGSFRSWVTQFLDAGASAFIGTLWRVSDKAAFKFTQELYKQLFAGILLGEAVQRARTSCKEPGDSSWLAYELYGQPNSPIKLGSR